MATITAPNDPDVQLAASQFLVTLGENLDNLDGRAAIFGTVVEGFDTLEKINGAFTDNNGRPLKDIRLRHTVILDDPFPDPDGLVEPSQSPIPTAAQLATVRIADDEELDENADQEALEKLRQEREARAQALTLEMVGDLPFAEVKPPENVLFVCKLNPVTQTEDLELIFSRFGKIVSCEVIRDRKTGDSLQYAFVEFEEQAACEQAYFKMDGVLIDDHRIHVDFSQSVSRLSDTWRNTQNTKRLAAHGGGFGGMDTLERRTQFRGQQLPRDRFDRNSRFGMVHDKDKNGSRHGEGDRARSRSPRRSPHRYRDRDDRHRRDRHREERKQDHHNHDRFRDDRDGRKHRRSSKERRRDRSRDRDHHHRDRYRHDDRDYRRGR
jgi:peptidyl-prolyl cis-trans isomerase-like 4